MNYSSNNDQEFEINTIVFDLNGVLTIQGEIVPGVKERVEQLNQMGIKTVFITGNRRGTADDVSAALGMEFKVGKTAAEKEQLFLEFDTATTAAIGNTRIDIGMLKHAAISVATIQSEGIHTGLIAHADILVPSVLDAMDLFIDPDSLGSAMKT